jgi:hypothetical protein
MAVRFSALASCIMNMDQSHCDLLKIDNLFLKICMFSCMNAVLSRVLTCFSHVVYRLGLSKAFRC